MVGLERRDDVIVRRERLKDGRCGRHAGGKGRRDRTALDCGERLSRGLRDSDYRSGVIEAGRKTLRPCARSKVVER